MNKIVSRKAIGINALINWINIACLFLVCSIFSPLAIASQMDDSELTHKASGQSATTYVEMFAWDDLETKKNNKFPLKNKRIFGVKGLDYVLVLP